MADPVVKQERARVKDLRHGKEADRTYFRPDKKYKRKKQPYRYRLVGWPTLAFFAKWSIFREHTEANPREFAKCRRLCEVKHEMCKKQRSSTWRDWEFRIVEID